jgi:1,2-diacylglycerol 3-beta-galactosyltransferase
MPNNSKHIVFVMSDTGGGHRAAAEAIQEAMESLYPDSYTYELVDVFRHYTPFPMTLMPWLYPHWVNFAAISWRLGYWFINSRFRSNLLLGLLYWYSRRKLNRLFHDHPADVVVSVHSVLTKPTLSQWRKIHTPPRPYVTVVTDLVSTPVFWYQLEVDKCLLPTQEAYQHGIEAGMSEEQLEVTGLPVHPQFIRGISEKQAARDMLGWDQDAVTVLVVSGGEGMGPLYNITRAIDAEKLDIQLVIVAGRNQQLKKKLETDAWNQPTHIYPFVEMAKFMSAADILITKAGPATISEACVVGLPIILSGYVPGQEKGNVDYVVNNGAGVYAPGPEEVVKALREWVKDQKSQQEYAASAAKLGCPEAAWDIAKEIDRLARQATESLAINWP